MGIYMKQVIDFLKKNISKDDKVIVGCSGGSDSMALLHVFTKNFSPNQVICAHINHKVRKESDYEYKYLEEYCKSNNIIFEGIEIQQVINKNFEAEARNFRYEFFKKLKFKYNAKYIITAHHKNDLVETVLMRISRGSTLEGYAGIKQKEEDYLRPFLQLSKKDILEYLNEHNIQFFEDYTNYENEHTRNRFRNQIIPLIQKENSNFENKILEFSKELINASNFINDYINNKQFLNKNELDINLVLQENIFIQQKCVERLIKVVQKKDVLDVNKKNVEDILKLINTTKSNAKISLSNGYIAKKEYGKLIITNEIFQQDFCEQFKSIFQTDYWTIKQVNQCAEKNNNTLRLNSSEINLPLYIRNKKAGDIIEVKNLGHKKVKDIFIDEKISLNDRKTIPIVVDSCDNILWIAGIKKSKFDKDKNEKYDIILISERK